MAFYETCQNLAKDLKEDDPNRKILEYLLTNAVGRKNLKSWDKIETDLVAAGVENLPSKENFQTGLLGKTRECEAFIGSSPKGFFIINDREDAYVTRDFYIKRITTQAARLDKLQKLIERQYPID